LHAARRRETAPTPAPYGLVARRRTSARFPRSSFPATAAACRSAARCTLHPVPGTVIVGAQWGDEGKGKIVDLLAQDSDIVCRYQGGPNAGHTIVVDDETYKIRALPSGIVRGKPCVIGNGCVVDLEVLIGELDEFESLGRSTAEVYVSGN